MPELIEPHSWPFFVETESHGVAWMSGWKHKRDDIIILQGLRSSVGFP